MISASSDQSQLKNVIKTSLPAVIDLSSQTIAWLIEAIFIGHLSAAALAGVGFALQIIILTFTVVLTFVVGASIIINRYLGADDTWNANHVLAQSLMLGTGMAFMITIIWYFGGTQIFSIIKEEEPLARSYGIAYLEMFSYFGPLVILNFIAIGILRMVGDAMTSMKINLFANITHLVLAFPLIFGKWGFPRMEAEGAALAMGIGHSLAFFITLYYLRSRKTAVYLSFKEYTTPNLETFRKLFKYGVPTTMEQLFWAIGQLVLSFFAGLMGVIPLAAHQVFVRIQSVIAMSFQGFGLASMMLVGKNIGAEKEHKAIAAGNSAAFVAFVASLAVAVVLIVFQDVWFNIFTSDATVIDYGTKVVLVLALIQIPKAVNIVFTGNLRGGADLKWLMWLALSSVISFETFGAYILTFPLGLSLMGLWLIQGIDETYRLTLNFWRFRQRKWKLDELD